MRMCVSGFIRTWFALTIIFYIIYKCNVNLLKLPSEWMKQENVAKLNDTFDFTVINCCYSKFFFLMIRRPPRSTPPKVHSANLGKLNIHGWNSNRKNVKPKLYIIRKQLYKLTNSCYIMLLPTRYMMGCRNIYLLVCDLLHGSSLS
jgi:hypothetical protein